MYIDSFDNAFRRDRIQIENAFAPLKNNWIVLRCLYFTLPYACQIIIAYVFYTILGG